MKKKYTDANRMVEAGFDAKQQLAQVSQLGQNDQNGKLLSAKKQMGFNTQIINGITTVTLPYELKYEKTEISFDVTLIDSGSGFKIRSIN